MLRNFGKRVNVLAVSSCGLLNTSSTKGLSSAKSLWGDGGIYQRDEG